MNKNLKSIFFVLVFISLLIVVSTVSATDDINIVSDTVDNSDISSQMTTQETVQTSSENNIENTEDNNIIKKENKTLKTTPIEHEVDSSYDWNQLVGSAGLAPNVNEKDSLVFTNDVSISGTNSYLINKPININGDDYTLSHTGSGKTSLYFNNGAKGSNITNLKFENIQIFVNTAEDIVFDNITFVVTQQGLGQGTGSFAIRDGSINITVKNSDFTTTSNGGYSTLVLTWVKDCTIDNNTITGTGNVGNLVYLNNYGGNTNTNGITNNSHNTISNNTITATNNGIFCYSLSISGANNTIINNVISNSYTYAITTIWAGSYDTEEPDDTHNVSYHGNKYINNTITGTFSTGNYSVVEDNSITGTSTIVGNANVTNNIFLGTVNLHNDICFKDNDASTVTVNVNLPNCHFKDNQINVLNIPTNANPTYDCGGNTIGTTNGNLQSCNCGGTCSQSGSNTQLIIKTDNTPKSEETPTQAEDFGIWIDSNTWEVNITEENYNQLLRDGLFTTSGKWFKSLANHDLILNIYYLDPEHTFILDNLKANVTFHFMNNTTLHNEIFSILDTNKGDIRYYIDGNLKIICDEDYLWREYDEYGYVTESHGLQQLYFKHTTTIKNLEYNINVTEDYLEVLYFIYHQYYSVINGDNLTLEDCTFNIQLPRDIKVYSTGFDSVNYTVQLLGTDPLENPRIGNFTIINCTFNINSLAENEDEYPYFYSNLNREDNQTFIFKDNIVNLNKVKGIQIATDGAIIENNTINSNYDYVVELIGNNNIVQDNVFIAKDNKGNDAVLDTGENNVVQNNGPNEQQAEPTLVIDTVEFTAKTNATISASIYSGDEKLEDINVGKVTFKVNGKTLKDTNGKVIYAKVLNGTATIENFEVPQEWTKEGTVIQAVYSGSSQCAKLTSEKTEITVTQEEVILTTEDITATAGSKITLTATLSDTSINTGKIVFKINGKVVKDANDKVIYSTVRNGTVSVEYTIPDTFKAKNYTITAMFISSNYSLNDTKTLTITA